MTKPIAAALAAAIALAAPPASAQSQRLDAAWEAALNERALELDDSQFAELNVIAYHSAVARLCDGFAVDVAKIATATDAVVAGATEGLEAGPVMARQADILIAAAGTPGIITPEMVKPGAAVVSAGITFEGRKLVPDVDESVAEVAGWITPRLGGVGPTTRAMLLRNTVLAAERRAARA